MKNYREQSHLPGTPVFDASGLLGAVINLFRNPRKSRVLAVLALAVMTLGILTPSFGQNAINCASGFTSSGACGVDQSFRLTNSGGTPSLSGQQVTLIPSGITHGASGLIYQTVQGDQAFSATFTFVPNGQNVAFVLENNNNNPGWDEGSFIGGAGCESGFFQAFGANAPPNNVFGLELDSQSALTLNGAFTYSSVQIYQAGQSPCLPNDNGPNYTPINKISTSPVNLTNGTQGTTTGDTYSVALNYQGSSLTINMFDVTAGGSCPGAQCFTYTWNNVNIPSWVGGNTAYVALTAATGETSNSPLDIDSFTYSPGQAPLPPVNGQAVAVQVTK